MGVTKKAIYRKSASQICCKESNFSLHAPFSRGERLIVLHAGSKAGFLKGTELVRKAKASTGDYHDEMNGDNFFKWVKEKLISHLPRKSVLIIDNARSLSQPPSLQVPHSSFQEGRHTGLVDKTTYTFWRNTVEGRASPDLQAA